MGDPIVALGYLGREHKKIDRDYWQGHIVTEQGGMTSN